MAPSIWFRRSRSIVMSGMAAIRPDGVGMRRLVDHLVHRADLGDAAGVHHGHAVAGLGDHAHVVRDQHHGGAALLADALEQLDDLRLDRHVERGGRLVGDDQLGLGRQRERDHHALAHAARELVRVVVDALRGGRDAGVLQQADGAPARLGLAHRQVRAGWSRSVAGPIGVERVQRGQRVLEDRADLAAADVAHRLVAAGCRCAGLPAGSAPPATRPGGSSRPMMAAPVSDLPAPDSPTTPRISPGAMSKEMSSSARSVPRRCGNSTTRF